MRVSLTMRVTEETAYEETRDSISEDWIIRLQEWGMTPVLVPNRLDNPSAFVSAAATDLIVLTGGGEAGSPSSRNNTELALIDLARRNKVPILGVCRGLQVVNEYFGGGSFQESGHVATIHSVQIEQEWQSIYGNQTDVNSFHNQCIDDQSLGENLKVTARDSEGHVEAVVHEDLPMAAIMWHPERPGACGKDPELLRRLAAEGAFWRRA